MLTVKNKPNTMLRINITYQPQQKDITMIISQLSARVDATTYRKFTAMLSTHELKTRDALSWALQDTQWPMEIPIEFFRGRGAGQYQITFWLYDKDKSKITTLAKEGKCKRNAIVSYLIDRVIDAGSKGTLPRYEKNSRHQFAICVDKKSWERVKDRYPAQQGPEGDWHGGVSRLCRKEIMSMPETTEAEVRELIKEWIKKTTGGAPGATTQELRNNGLTRVTLSLDKTTAAKVRLLAKGINGGRGAIVWKVLDNIIKREQLQGGERTATKMVGKSNSEKKEKTYQLLGKQGGKHFQLRRRCDWRWLIAWITCAIGTMLAGIGIGQFLK